MRVITGQAKGRRLKAPKGMNTRPTSDRTKESLFNIIGDRLLDKAVLDLYAGTGAIGIEALSRGADSAVFVEKDQRVVKIIRANLDLTGLADQAEIISQDVDSTVARLASQQRTFDIIFLDPPYLRNLLQKSIETLVHYQIIRPGGLVVAESSKLDTLSDKYGNLRLIRQERYGDTVLSFYQELGAI